MDQVRMSGFKLDDGFEAALIADLEPRLDRAANTMADALHENVSEGPRSGIHWPGLPRQSSSPSEFPQRQSGALQDAVGVDNAGELERHSGFVKPGNSQGKLNALEWGYEPNNLKERAPLARTFESEDVQRAALEAMRDE